MTPHIDGPHHNTNRPLCHDLNYEIRDGVPIIHQEPEHAE